MMPSLAVSCLLSQTRPQHTDPITPERVPCVHLFSLTYSPVSPVEMFDLDDYHSDRWLLICCFTMDIHE